MQDNNNRSKFSLLIDCPERIPCNPCEDVCPKKVIHVGRPITNAPVVVDCLNCTGCGLCVAGCPGMAIFLVDHSYHEDLCEITLPYELSRKPAAGQSVIAVDGDGSRVCTARVASVREAKKFRKTILITLEMPRIHVTSVRGIKL